MRSNQITHSTFEAKAIQSLTGIFCLRQFGESHTGINQSKFGSNQILLIRVAIKSQIQNLKLKQFNPLREFVAFGNSERVAQIRAAIKFLTGSNLLSNQITNSKFEAKAIQSLTGICCLWQFGESHTGINQSKFGSNQILLIRVAIKFCLDQICAAIKSQIQNLKLKQFNPLREFVAFGNSERVTQV